MSERQTNTWINERRTEWRREGRNTWIHVNMKEGKNEWMNEKQNGWIKNEQGTDCLNELTKKGNNEWINERNK